MPSLRSLKTDWDATSVVPYLDMALLDVLSFTAIITTLGLFLCGIPICRNIATKGSTEGISGAPFLLGTIGSVFWLRYGFLKADGSIITINGIGSLLQIIYLMFYHSYCPQKRTLNRQIALIAVLTLAMLAYVHAASVVPEVAVEHLGMMCLTFNILNFAAPLAGLRDVLRMKSTENLPLPMCAANLLVSLQWFWYGVLVNDKYMKIPNFVGIILALFQLSLFVIYPRSRARD